MGGEVKMTEFIGAIVQMLGVEKTVQVMETIASSITIKKLQGPEINFDGKIQSLYKFRKLNELENHIGYNFIDKKLLV